MVRLSSRTKKGQVSTEMLILLALLLVILLSVIFSALTVERPLFGAYQNTQAQQWQTSAVSVDTIIISDGALFVSVTNRLKTTIVVTNVTADGVLLSASDSTTLNSGSSVVFTVATSSLQRISLIRPVITYSLVDNSLTSLQVAFTQDIPVQ